MRIGSQNSISTLDLRNTSQVIARALERLSSGKRLNSPSDGIADYATSIRLDSQVKGLAQINLGLNQASGLLQTATSAISTQIDIVEQMRQIAIQGANTFLSTSERDSLNAELNSLRDEFNRIARSTEFAGIDLFNSPSGNISFLLDEENSLNIDSSNNLATDLFTKTVGTEDPALNVFSNDFGAGGDEVATHDVNGDGFDDVLYHDTDDNEIEIRLSDGQGGFNVVSTIAHNGINFNTADLNNDGEIDIIAADESLDTVLIYFGEGDGNFTLNSSYDFDSGVIAFSTTAADIDGDSDLDLITRTNSATEIYLNDGTGSFTLSSTSSPTHTTFADINSDGFADKVYGLGSNLGISLGNGDGSFQSAITTAVEGIANDLIFEDLNGDGNLDYLAATSTGLEVWLGDGSGNFNFSMTYSGNEMRGIDTTDYNNDGILDIIVGDYDELTIDILIGNGQGGFSLFTRFDEDIGFVAELSAGDFNGDGIDDIAHTGDLSQGYLISATREVAAVGDLNVNNTERAGNLLEILDRAVEGLEGIQGDIAADLTRAEVALNSNLLLSEDLQDAKFNIEAADFAIETANLVSAQIQQQAQIAALTQANASLGIVLNLLEGLEI